MSLKNIYKLVKIPTPQYTLLIGLKYQQKSKLIPKVYYFNSLYKIVK